MIHHSVPNRLADELAGNRVVIVLGAGVSATARNRAGESPLLWGPLLAKAATSVLHDQENRDFAEYYNGSGRYLEAAEVIVRQSPSGELGDFLEGQLRHRKFSPSKLHSVIRDLDARIVVTTNYDTIYEDLCCSGDARAGYSIIKYYDSNLVESLRSKQSLIIKAHGCITDVGKIILSRTQYAIARRQHHAFFKVLDATFLLNTVFFIGCSLDDPDLQLLLQNAAIATPKTRPHYALLPSDVPLPILRSFDDAYNIEPWVYKHDTDHAQALTSLEELLVDVMAKRML